MQNMASSFSPCVLALLLLSLFISISTWPAHAEATSNQESFEEEKPLQFVNHPGTPKCPGSIAAQILGKHTGYININGTVGDARMFYYFFPALFNAQNAPVLIYLMGGPGYPVSLAVLYENGPYYLRNDLSLGWNFNSWNMVANVLYVDQPLGTGFSYSTNPSDIPETSKQAAEHLYSFLQGFYEKYSRYVKNDLYIAGESYAAHYIPAFATRIKKGNQENGTHINLKGILIACPWASPALQYTSYPDYARKMGLINKTQYNKMTTPFSSCKKEAQDACDGTYNITTCADAYVDCNDNLWKYIIYPLGGERFNYFDIRKKCDHGEMCYGFSNMVKFLNQTCVKKALGVDPNFPFVLESDDVYAAMAGDQMRSYANAIAKLLKEDEIRLLIYVGEHDLIANWIGNLMWVNEMKWPGQTGFLNARNVTFKVDGWQTAGWSKSNQNLTFVMLKDAGHFIPMDQPKATYQMITKWFKDIPL